MGNPITPLNYKLSLDVDMKYFRYFGEETITIELKEPTDKIILNSVGLEITRCKITANGDTITPKQQLDKEKEELVLQQPQRVEKLLEALDENEAVQDIFTNCQPW